MKNPKWLPGDIAKYKGSQAHIFGVYSSGEVWRYEVQIKRGKNRGTYSFTESELQDAQGTYNRATNNTA